MKNRNKQFFIFSSMSLLGMLISHYIPTTYFVYWVVISLLIGHLINVQNYK